MRFMCAYDSLISVHEAITLITLSLIMPEKSTNKPIVYGINEESKIKKIEIDYDNILLFKELDNILFKEVILKLKIKNFVILTLTIFSHFMNGIQIIIKNIFPMFILFLL